MDFLRELLKMKEGFMPDLESMTDQQLVDLCREIGEEDACKMDADGRLVNREQLIRDLQTGSIGDADIDTPMGPREDVDMSYDHVERDHDEAYEPDQQDVDHNEDAIRDDMGEQQPMEAYTNLRKSFNLHKPSFNLYKPVKMKKGLMQKGVKTTKENVDMEQARTMHRWREADLQHRDEDARAEVSVPREIDRTKHANALAVWNDSMQKQETLEMVWPKLVAAMQTIKESTYKKIPGSLGGKKVAKVLLKEDTIPVVKFKDPYNKLVTPAHGGLQKDVTNKSVDKAIEDEIGNDGMKGMKKKDRPYMEKPRFRDWLTANMVFNMTRSGELAGKMKLGESERKYAGKHPKKIKSVAGQGRGKVSVLTNDGTKHTVLAKDTGGAMPKVGEPISKYISEDTSKKKISEAKQMCEWFARCKNPATGTTPHPILGNVPTCDRCHKFATDKPRKASEDENFIAKKVGRLMKDSPKYQDLIQRYGKSAEDRGHDEDVCPDCGRKTCPPGCPSRHSENEETTNNQSTKVFNAHIPANIYAGKYYDYRTVRIQVAAQSEEEVIAIVNKYRPKVLEMISKKRMRSGARTVPYVKIPADENVFFKGSYHVKPVSEGSLNALTNTGNVERFEGEGGVWTRRGDPRDTQLMHYRDSL